MTGINQYFGEVNAMLDRLATEDELLAGARLRAMGPEPCTRPRREGLPQPPKPLLRPQARSSTLKAQGSRESPRVEVQSFNREAQGNEQS